MEVWRQITGEGLKIDSPDNIYISGEDTGDMFFIKFLLKPGFFDLSSDAEDLDTDGIFILNWTESDDEQNYSIYQYDNFFTVINNSLTLVLEETTTLSLPLSGYSNGIYYFIAVAYNEYGNSTSNCIEITIQIPQDIPNDNNFITMLIIFFSISGIAIVGTIIIITRIIQRK